MHLLPLTVLLATAVSASKTGQASNFDVFPSVVASLGCDSLCQANLDQNSAADLAVFDTPFDFDFYATASNFSSSSPGDLLKLKPLNGTALDIPGGYISSAANANDVYWSVVAARNTFPAAFTHEWVSIGHSQGGGAVYKLSEPKLVQDKASGYLGGVSIAPVAKIYDSLLQAVTSLGDGASGGYETVKAFGVLPSLVFGVQTLFPNYTAPFLAESMRQRMQLARKGQYCDVALSGIVADLSVNDLIGNFTATDAAVLQRFQEINAPAQGDTATKPLLLIQGENDTILPAGNPVRLSLYPGLDHSAAVGASAPEWLAFIQGLFAGTVNLPRCVNETLTPFDAEHAAAPADDV
ncbi:hypothetical protein BDW62DRAFT_218059 [Aspergillus aurantiobrunneus]